MCVKEIPFDRLILRTWAVVLCILLVRSLITYYLLV